MRYKQERQRQRRAPFPASGDALTPGYFRVFLCSPNTTASVHGAPDASPGSLTDAADSESSASDASKAPVQTPALAPCLQGESHVATPKQAQGGEACSGLPLELSSTTASVNGAPDTAESERRSSDAPEAPAATPAPVPAPSPCPACDALQGESHVATPRDEEAYVDLRTALRMTTVVRGATDASAGNSTDTAESKRRSSLAVEAPPETPAPVQLPRPACDGLQGESDVAAPRQQQGEEEEK